jgi:hypothetical protein
MKRILDPDFKYVSAASTDIRKTFARARKEQKKATQRRVVPFAASQVKK